VTLQTCVIVARKLPRVGGHSQLKGTLAWPLSAHELDTLGTDHHLALLRSIIWGVGYLSHVELDVTRILDIDRVDTPPRIR